MQIGEKLVNTNADSTMLLFYLQSTNVILKIIKEWRDLGVQLLITS